MNTGSKLPVSVLLLMTPLSAYAEIAPPTGVLLSFAGGFGGGFLGALLACWLCKRWASKDDHSSKR
jgi:hypothetical protein